jgi:hypothetical protein
MDAWEELEFKTTLPRDSGERKARPLYSGVMKYFPAALAATARVSKAGNDKHNPGAPLHHARGKSTDHADCILRHLVDLEEDFGRGVGYDESGMPQVGYIVWRAMALAQEWLEKHEGAPLAPGAVLPPNPTQTVDAQALNAFYAAPPVENMTAEEIRAHVHAVAQGNIDHYRARFSSYVPAGQRGSAR